VTRSSWGSGRHGRRGAAARSSLPGELALGSLRIATTGLQDTVSTGPRPRPGRPCWTRRRAGGLSLPQGPAEQFGCFDAVRTQITRHRTERACYRPALRIVDQHLAAIAVEEVEAYLWPPEAPPDDEGRP
jgi:hypothetical protein